MKWKQFLPIWLIVFLLAPSIWVHRILMLGARPPGSPTESPPLMIPFGWLYFGKHLWEQLVRGDFSDALVIFLVMHPGIYLGSLRKREKKQPFFRATSESGSLGLAYAVA